MNNQKKSILGISFDAVAMSGLIAEFLKVASFFHKENFDVHLNLGYDIKADKKSFFRRCSREKTLLPPWVNLVDFDLDSLKGRYGEALVASILDTYITRELDIPDHVEFEIESLASQIAEALVKTFNALGVAYLIIENGTLPENIIFSRALYKAIDRYGKQQRMGRFVFWRDHDLMQTSEPLRGKYGSFPYKNVPKPRTSPFIQYIVQHEANRLHMVQWSGISNISIIPNCFSLRKKTVTPKNASFRSTYGIPENAFLITRCTRIIPQKRIDRELVLLAELKRRLPTRTVWLFITGDQRENPEETKKLIGLARNLGVLDQVVFGGCFATFDRDFLNEVRTEQFTVWDILANADLNSFLTSFDYESYGNPIGEAIASGVPYLATTYSLYDDVYGTYGFQGILMNISKDNDGMPENEFIDQVAALICDPGHRAQMVENNFALGSRYLSMESFERNVREIFPFRSTRYKAAFPSSVSLTAAEQ